MTYLASILDKRCAISPTKSPRPSADVLIHNFLASTLIVTYTNSNDAASKQESAWPTNPRDSTTEEKPNGNVDHCKNLALTDYRRSNRTPSYWEMEVTHLKEEFWIIQGLGSRQCRVESEEEDESISSKLRWQEPGTIPA